MGGTERVLIATFAVLLPIAPASARDALGIFESWGAFRDSQPSRCYAIAEPSARASAKARWHAFASIAHWPRNGTRNQLHIRLSHEKAPQAPVTLTIGERRFTLVGGGADAWAADARMDAAIVAAMRSAQRMTVRSRTSTGRSFSDSYALPGAATAIDAAALACAR